MKTFELALYPLVLLVAWAMTLWALFYSSLFTPLRSTTNLFPLQLFLALEIGAMAVLHIMASALAAAIACLFPEQFSDMREFGREMVWQGNPVILPLYTFPIALWQLMKLFGAVLLLTVLIPIALLIGA